MRSITTMTMHKKNRPNWSEKPVKEVLKDGYNSVIVEPDSKESLVEAFNDIVRNEENYYKIGKQARKDAFEQYSWKVRVEKILKWMN